MCAVKSLRMLAVALGLLGPLLGLAADPDFDRSFLTDYSKLQSRPTERGAEFVYIPAGVIERLAKYNGVMVDQPEVLISPKSDYKGAKPADLLAVADLMRDSLKQRLSKGGYNVVETPGEGIIYIRLALTDLELKKKKRGLLAYTPIGAVVKVGADAIKDMMEKYDIMNMAIQAELTDSQSNEPLAAVVAVRGGEDKPVRMDFDQLDADMADFSSRLRCRLDNARVPADQQIDCLDRKARQAREQAAGKT